jgi:protein gp37
VNKSDIEWTDFTWNPVTGCKHGCSYCYARKIAKRFTGHFKPEFHPERLSDPLKRRRPARIFVCSMADLFGDWVPSEWIEAVLETVQSCPQHTFIFLTKNPKRYYEWLFTKNCLLGATATDQKTWDAAIKFLSYAIGFPQENICSAFISAEPLLGMIKPHGIEQIDWLIIGANSNRGAECPKSIWAMDLIHAARTAGVPVFVKNNWPDNFMPRPQEFPAPMDLSRSRMRGK